MSRPTHPSDRYLKNLLEVFTIRVRSALTIILVLLLAGCQPFIDADQPRASESMVAVGPAEALGQTFVARHAGLSGAEFWIEPGSEATGTLRFSLRTGTDSLVDLATASVSVDSLTAPGFVRFDFDPVRDSHGRDYYAFIVFEGGGELQVGREPAEGYLDGALYSDHVSLDAQASFRLVYSPTWVVVDLLGSALRGVGLIGVALLLYAVPGWALLAWVCPQGRLIWPERLALAVGISLAFYPMLLVWTDFVGLHLGALNAWLPVVIGLAALAWRYRTWRPSDGREALRRWWRSDAVWPDVTLLVVLSLVFGVRLLVVRTLDAPMWGDSYQHATIAQLLVDNGGVFDSWEPYAPYGGLTVHIGFHTFVALFMWVTGASSLSATIWAGQLLNGLAVLTLYPLAVRVARGRRWAGIGAVVAAGLLSPMPAYYVNWGRYAQLAGQAILPVALWLLWTVFEDVKANAARREVMVALGGLVLAGMTLSYYRMPFYLVAFAVPWFVLWSWKSWRSGGDGRVYGNALLRVVLLGGISLLLFAPWFGGLAGSSLANSLEKGLMATPALDIIKAEYQVWKDVLWYVPMQLMACVLITFVWSVVRKCWEPFSVVLWVLVLGGLVAGRLINLPGANLMQNFSVVIMLYIPVGLLVGWLAGQLGEIASGYTRSFFPTLVLVALMLLASLWGAGSQTRIVDTKHIMVTRPDVRAMAWIRENVPQDARFLVEGFRIYGGRSAVGADAGWWIPLFTQRANTMPPQYAILTAVPNDLEYSRRVVDLVAALEKVPLASDGGVRLLCDEDVTHVYVGQGQGLVGGGVRQLFKPQDLLDRPEYSLIYHQDRVYIFEVVAGVCPGLKP